MKKSKIHISAPIWLKFCQYDFFAIHDYLDDFQDINKQFGEGLLLRWNLKVMKKSKYIYLL